MPLSQKLKPLYGARMNLWRVSRLARRRGGKNARAAVRSLLMETERKIHTTLKNL